MPALAWSRSRWSALLVATLALAGSGSGPTAAIPAADAVSPPATEAPPDAGRIALLVAVGEYAPESGWAAIGSRHDLDLVRAALEHHGFGADDIHVVADREATREGIEAAFRRHLLAAAEPGDVVVFHFSGHGHRITDDNHDEIDGYDEVLVPYDAPQRPTGPYGGDRHLRDDQLQSWLDQLRLRVGPRGDVLVSLDSCFSGSATRGVEGVARGSEIPIGPPQQPSDGPSAEAEDDAGFLDRRTRGAVGAAGAESLAPYTFFSAARHDELAFETRDERGLPVGSLSFALSRALVQAGPTTSYRALFDRVRRLMAAEVSNRPQAEGDLDRAILDGRAIAQRPYVPVIAFDRHAKTAELAGGSLIGLLVGTRVALHPIGTTDPDASGALARGEVVTASPFRAGVRLDELALEAPGSPAWAFVTEPSFGSLRVRTRIAADGAAWRETVIETLTATPFVELVSAGADVAVLDRDGLVAETAIDAVPLLGPVSGSPQEVAVALRDRMVDFARNRLLRRIELEAPGLAVRFELIPCELECTSEEITGDERCECGRALDVRSPADQRDGLEMSIGDGFRIRLVNEGRRDAWVTLLDLMPDGQVQLLWPLAEHGGEDNLLARGDRFEVPIAYRVGRPTGLEVIKLFATLHPVDFRPITSGGFRRQETRGPLDSLFERAFDGTRAQPTLPRGSVATWSVALSVEEAR